MTDGSIERVADQVTLRYERRLPHPIETVWSAITDPMEIARWAGSKPEIELWPGGTYVSYHGDEMRVVDRVTRVEPPRLFEHTFWQDINPSALVTWSLEPTPSGCLLILEHRLSDDDIANATRTIAPGDHPVQIISRSAAGWHHLLDLLQAALDGGDASWSREDQKDLQGKYADLARQTQDQVP